MNTYLKRYKNGEYKAVWRELTAMGDGILEPEIYDDAVAVARETMKRVRYNVELLHERLLELKYVFEKPEYAFRKAIPEERRKHLPYIEKTFGKLPLSLRMWYEEVGDVAFIGAHPLLANLRVLHGEVRHPQPECCLYSDPLFCFVWEFDPKYLYTFTSADATGFIEFTPDGLHKAHVSGGSPLKLKLDDNYMDSFVHGFFQEMYFIDYLRWAFHWGGFPGFERHLTEETNVNYGWRQEWKFPLIELSYLTEGLLDF